MIKRVLFCFFSIILFLFSAPITSAETIQLYENGRFTSAFENWSWGGTLDWQPDNFSFTPTNGWAALRIRAKIPVQVTDDSTFSFRVNPQESSQAYVIRFFDFKGEQIGPTRLLSSYATTPISQWTTVAIPLRDFQFGGKQLGSIVLQSWHYEAQPSMSFSNLSLVDVPSQIPPNFVTRSGTELLLQGQRFRFVGANVYDAAGIQDGYHCGAAYSPERLTTVFSELRSNGASAVRFWAYQSYTNGATDWTQFDKVIQAAEQNNIRLIAVLEDQWGHCSMGGNKDAAWYQDGYKGIAGYPLSYRDYVGRVLEKYNDESTILGWMLMNEAETHDHQALLNFVADMGSYVKTIDRNHLLTVGTIGTGQAGTEMHKYQALYKHPSIDFVEAHDYYYVEQALPGSDGSNLPDPKYCYNTIACDLVQAKTILKKPFVIGESGIMVGTKRTQEQRAELFRNKIQTFFSFGGAGYLIWDYNTQSSGFSFNSVDPINQVLRNFVP